MSKTALLANPNRRQFLRCTVAGGALICLGCPGLLAVDPAKEKKAAKPPVHKFKEKAEMTYEEIFKLAYAEGMIPIMKQMAEALGRDKLIAMIKDAATRISVKETTEWARKFTKHDLQAWTAEFRKPSQFWQHVITFQLVEDTPQAVEYKITECIWAKTFRDADAGDIGYAAICYGDIASAPAFNPKMKFTRTKTLMQGQPYCNHRYVLEV